MAIKINCLNICNFEFVTYHKDNFHIYKNIYKTPTLLDLIYPLEVICYYDTRMDISFCKTYSSYWSIQHPELINFDNLKPQPRPGLFSSPELIGVHNGDFSLPQSFIERLTNHQKNVSSCLLNYINWGGYDYNPFFTDFCIFSAATLYPELFFPYGLAHDMCMPLKDPRNITYYFNVLLNEERSPYLTKDNILKLINEQKQAAGSFYLECNLLSGQISKEGRYIEFDSAANYFKKNKELKLVLESGDLVCPFIGGINYFSDEIWTLLGEDRHKIIAKYCYVEQINSGGVFTALKTEGTSEAKLAGYPNDADLINQINQEAKLGSLTKRSKPYLHLAPFAYVSERGKTIAK